MLQVLFPILRNPICLCLIKVIHLPNKVPTHTPNKVIILHHLKDTPNPMGTLLKVHLHLVNSLIILLLKTLKIPRNGVEEFSLVISDTESKKKKKNWPLLSMKINYYNF